MAAPTCRLQPPPPTFDTTPPNTPPIPLVTFNTQGWNIPPPQAAQIQAMVLTINSLANAVNAITGRGAGPNNLDLQMPGPGFGGTRIGGVNFPNSRDPQNKSNKPQNPKQQQQKKQTKTKHGVFKEVSRSTKKVRVYNPQDKTQYVDVKQITSLVMRNSVTGDTWQWKFS